MAKTGTRAYLVRDIPNADMNNALKRAKAEGGKNLSDMVRFWLRCYGKGMSMPEPTYTPTAAAASGSGRATATG